MKKLILLVLALSLCFMIGCKEKNEPIKEIENTEVPKIEEPITEPEVEEPIEETPVEPEAEEPIAEKPEVEEPVEEIDENVIILPEPDENTKVIKIEFPEDFPLEPYTEPELVSPEEFEWGEYVPFVRYAWSWFGDDVGPTYTYAFLGEDVNTLYEGNVIYSKLNEKYSIDSTDLIPENLTFFGKEISGLREHIEDEFYKSHIIHISEDAQEIGVLSLIDTQEERDSNVTGDYHNGWNANYTLYNNNNVVFEETKKAQDSSFYLEHAYIYKRFSYNGQIQEGDDYVMRIWNQTIRLYDKNKERMLYEINLPENNVIIDGEEKYFPGRIAQVIGKDYALVEFRIERQHPEEKSSDYDHAVYLLDLNTTEMTLLENRVWGSKLSPDRKYLIYRFTKWIFSDTYPKNQCAFYIKNLETNQTVKYDYKLQTSTSDYIDDVDKFFAYSVVGWVNSKALKNILE